MVDRAYGKLVSAVYLLWGVLEKILRIKVFGKLWGNLHLLMRAIAMYKRGGWVIYSLLPTENDWLYCYGQKWCRDGFFSHHTSASCQLFHLCMGSLSSAWITKGGRYSRNQTSLQAVCKGMVSRPPPSYLVFYSSNSIIFFSFHRHPDKNKDENAEAKFVEINRAYEVSAFVQWSLST